jgi:GT2 family glycosyltransferase
VDHWEVRGWCADESGIEDHLTVEIFADDTFIGTVQCDQHRPDVQNLVGGSGFYGFTFRFSASHSDLFQTDRWISAREQTTRRFFGRILSPRSSLPERIGELGRLRTELEQIKTVLSRIEAEMPVYNRQFGFPLTAYSEYFAAYSQNADERLAAYRDRLNKLSIRSVVSIIMFVDGSSLEALDSSVQSVRQQIYPAWELVTVIDGTIPQGDAIKSFLTRQARIEPRVKPAIDEFPRSDRVEWGLRQCSGEAVGFLKCGDRLAPDALFHAMSTAQDGLAGLIYTDEDEFEILGDGSCVHHTPKFKPDFDLDLLLSHDYLGSFFLSSARVLAKVVPLGAQLFGAQRHDLALRLIEHLEPAQIRHVPRVLYHRNATRDSSNVESVAPACTQEESVRAVNAYFSRNGIAATAEPHTDPLGRARPGAARIKWALPEAPPMVSIIIPTRDRKDLLGPCLDSLALVSIEYPGQIEIIVVDNDTTEPEAKALLTHIVQSSRGRVLGFSGPFNWSAMNNFAAEQARGEVLIFLNNDTLVLSEGWCAELVSQACRPEIGAVGARLLYEDGLIQHAGVVTGIGRGLAANEGVGETVADGGYLGRSHLQRGVSAVTGACLATRKAVFEQVQGFDEVYLPIAFNDVDYCLKVRHAKLRVIYTPFATMYHYESKSRGIATVGKARQRQEHEERNFQLRYQDRIADPFYNPNFDSYDKPFAVLRPPRWDI